MGMAWGQILRRQRSGVRIPPEATDILSKENTYFKRVALAYFDKITIHSSGSTITNEHVGFF